MKKRIISLLLVLSMLLCVLPAASADETVGFYSTYLTLNESIDINFVLTEELPDGYSVKFSVDGGQNYVACTKEKTKNERPVYTYTGLTAKDMGKSVMATIFDANGASTGISYSRSVKAYCLSMLSKTSSGTLKALLVDMLNYGAAAETYFNGSSSLLDDIAFADKALATKAFPVLESHMNDDYGDYWASATLALENNIKIRFDVYPNGIDPENLTLKVDGQTVNHYNETGSGANGTYYSFYYDGLNPTQMRQKVTAQVYDGDAAVGNALTYSVVSYVDYTVNESTSASQALKTLADAAIKYGDSAEYWYDHQNDAVDARQTVLVADDFSSIANWGKGTAVTEEKYNYGITDGQLKIELVAGNTGEVTVKHSNTFDSTKKTIIEFEITVSGATGTNFQAGLILRNEKTVFNDGIFAVDVGLLGGGYVRQWSGKMSSVADGTHIFKIVTNPENNTVDVYLDGQSIGSNLSFVQKATTYWNELRLSAKNNNSENNLSVCFDNLTVTTINEVTE